MIDLLQKSGLLGLGFSNRIAHNIADSNGGIHHVESRVETGENPGQGHDNPCGNAVQGSLAVTSFQNIPAMTVKLKGAYTR